MRPRVVYVYEFNGEQSVSDFELDLNEPGSTSTKFVEYSAYEEVGDWCTACRDKKNKISRENTTLIKERDKYKDLHNLHMEQKHTQWRMIKKLEQDLDRSQRLAGTILTQNKKYYDEVGKLKKENFILKGNVKKLKNICRKATSNQPIED